MVYRNRGTTSTILADGALVNAPPNFRTWTVLAADKSIGAAYASVAGLGSASGVYRSEASPGTWERISSKGFCTNLAIDRANPAVLYITCADGFSMSTDKGVTWSPTDASLRPTAIAAGPNGDLFAVTAEGIVRRSAGGEWGRAGNGPANTRLAGLAADPTGQSGIFAHGSTFEDLYVGTLSSDGSELLFATYLGGASMDRPGAVAHDREGALWLSGRSFSRDFLSPDGSEPGVFVLKLHPLRGLVLGQSVKQLIPGLEYFPASLAINPVTGDAVVGSQGLTLVRGSVLSEPQQTSLITQALSFAPDGTLVVIDGPTGRLHKFQY